MASVAGEHFDMSFDDNDQVLEMMDVSEIDGALLMELLEEYSQPDQEPGSYRTVACYMEAETGASCSPLVGIAGGGWTQDSIHPHDEYCEDCGLDDILSDLNCYDCSPMSPCLLVEEDLLDWNEMEAAETSPSGSDVGGWYVDDCMHGYGTFFGHGDLDGYSPLYMHMDNSVDEFYITSSLWE